MTILIVSLAALLLSACDASQRVASDFQRDIGRVGDKIGVSGAAEPSPNATVSRSSRPTNGKVEPVRARKPAKTPAEAPAQAKEDRPATGMLYDRMADADVVLAAKLLQDAMEKARDDEKRSWKNSRNGHSGTITPVRTFAAGNGLRCREYRETLAIDGETDTYTNTACRNEHGRWLWTE